MSQTDLCYVEAQFLLHVPRTAQRTNEFENHMVHKHASIFPTYERLWTMTSPKIPSRIKRSKIDAADASWRDQMSTLWGSHLSRILLYRHFYLVHGIDTCVARVRCVMCSLTVILITSWRRTRDLFPWRLNVWIRHGSRHTLRYLDSQNSTAGASLSRCSKLLAE